MIKRYLLAAGVILSSLGYCGASGISATPSAWNIGIVTASAQYERSFTITNTGDGSGSELLDVTVSGNDSDDWVLGAVAGASQFRVQFWRTKPTTGTVDNLTYAFQSDGGAMDNLKKDLNVTMRLRLTAPSSSVTGTTQTIVVNVRGTVDTAYAYNTTGNFYWRNAGDVGEPETSDWSDGISSILPETKWQFMTNPTIGWRSSQPTEDMVYDNDANWTNTVVASFLRTATAGVAFTGTCLQFGHSALKSLTTVMKNRSSYLQTVGVTLFGGYQGVYINSVLGTTSGRGSSYLSQGSNSRTWTSSSNARASFSITYCSLCGLMMNTSSVSTTSSIIDSPVSMTFNSYDSALGSNYSRIVILD